MLSGVKTVQRFRRHTKRRSTGGHTVQREVPPLPVRPTESALRQGERLRRAPVPDPPERIHPGSAVPLGPQGSRCLVQEIPRGTSKNQEIGGRFTSVREHPEHGKQARSTTYHHNPPSQGVFSWYCAAAALFQKSGDHKRNTSPDRKQKRSPFQCDCGTHPACHGSCCKRKIRATPPPLSRPKPPVLAQAPHTSSTSPSLALQHLRCTILR